MPQLDCKSLNYGLFVHTGTWEPPDHYALNAIASLLTNGSADAFNLDWAALRYKHTSTIRFALAEKYTPVTANKILGLCVEPQTGSNAGLNRPAGLSNTTWKVSN